jgi:eukaryotic translation initiation factor 2C
MSQIPPRPRHGILGKKIGIYANYFKVPVPSDLTLTRYNVEVTPKAKGKKLGRIFQLVLELPEFAGVATEWKSMIISSRPLNILNEYSIGIPYLAEGQDEPLACAITYTVKVVTPLSFSVSDLISYLSAVNPGPNYLQKAEIVQVQGL